MSRLPDAVWINVNPSFRRFDRPVLDFLAREIAIADWQYCQSLDEPASLDIALVLIQDYHTRKSSAALHLSGIQKRFSDGISDWARKWALPQDLCHRVGKKSGESDDGSDEEGSEEEEEAPGNVILMMKGFLRGVKNG